MELGGERLLGLHQLLHPRLEIARVGLEGELKGVALFLASDASNYITGQTIFIDGAQGINQ